MTIEMNQRRLFGYTCLMAAKCLLMIIMSLLFMSSTTLDKKTVLKRGRCINGDVYKIGMCF